MAGEKQVSYLEEVLRDELHVSKSRLSTWGRTVILAIDTDDPLKLKRAYEDMVHLGANIDVQTTHAGYGGYTWTPWIHQFLGDTALHIALKQEKIKCISMLLMLDANGKIPNDIGETAETLAPKVMKQSYQYLVRNSMKVLYRSLPPSDFEFLPDKFLHRGIEEEAMRLMLQGRITYTEMPAAYVRAGNTKLYDNTRIIENKNQKRDPNNWRWCKDSTLDIIETVRRQVNRRNAIKHDQFVRENGITSGAHSSEYSDERFSGYYKRFNKTAGFKHMKRFIGWNQKEEEKISESVDENENRSDFGTVTSKAMSLTAGGRGLADIEKFLPHRYITVLSTATNLKYVTITPPMMHKLAQAMRTDDLITDIILGSGGVSDASASKLCATIPTMTSLTHLDLSFNAITNDGCVFIADALKNSRCLERLVLRGNRIGEDGAELVVRAMCVSSACKYIK